MQGRYNMLPGDGTVGQAQNQNKEITSCGATHRLDGSTRVTNCVLLEGVGERFRDGFGGWRYASPEPAERCVCERDVLPTCVLRGCVKRAGLAMPLWKKDEPGLQPGEMARYGRVVRDALSVSRTGSLGGCGFKPPLRAATRK